MRGGPYLASMSVPANNGRRIAEGQHRLQSVGTRSWLDGIGRGGTFSSASWPTTRPGSKRPSSAGTRSRNTHRSAAGFWPRAMPGLAIRAALAAYCGRSDKLDRAMAEFAFAYADQTTRDHELLFLSRSAGGA